jgi:hypothetical protein
MPMQPHDPYGPMLEELCRLNDADTEELFQSCLEQSQCYVTNLRIAYKKSPSNVDFSCQHTRAAYLLAYYPNYIEPIYETLCKIPQEFIQSAFAGEKLRGLFLGAGPAPEVLGWIAFLNEHLPDVRRATAYLLDKYIDGWRTGQEITRYHLAQHYWPNGHLTLRPMGLDFLNLEILNDPFVQRSIKISNIVVMQNCLNDQLNNQSVILEMLKRVFVQCLPGTLFVIVDLQYQKIRDLIRKMQSIIVNEDLGQIVLPVAEGPILNKANIHIPPIILDHLLIGDASKYLIARENTWYYYAAFQRTEAIEEVSI